MPLYPRVRYRNALLEQTGRCNSSTYPFVFVSPVLTHICGLLFVYLLLSSFADGA